MSLTAIMGILLAIAVAGDAVLAKLYVGAEKKVAQVQQAFDSFKDEERALGEEARKKAAAEQMADKLAKDSADAENAATVARLNASIAKLRTESDRARAGFLSAATACPASAEGAARYRAAYESGYRELVEGLRAQGDRGTKTVAALNSVKTWAQNGAPR